MRFLIHCSVSGGVTGHRTSILKSGDKIREFTSREDAQKVADELTTSGNNPRATCTFNYWVVEDPQAESLSQKSYEERYIRWSH